MGGIGSGKRPTAKTLNPSVYKVWLSILSRCYRKGDISYPRYGGIGVAVCQRWRDSFEAFLQDMGPRPSGTSIDRYPNSKGGYEPGNCRWATAKEQNRNHPNNRILEMNGERASLAEWAERYGISRYTVRNRLSDGWSVEKALTTPVKSRKR